MPIAVLMEIVTSGTCQERGELAKVLLIEDINIKREKYKGPSVNFPFSICSPVTADSLVVRL